MATVAAYSLKGHEARARDNAARAWECIQNLLSIGQTFFTVAHLKELGYGGWGGIHELQAKGVIEDSPYGKAMRNKVHQISSKLLHVYGADNLSKMSYWGVVKKSSNLRT